MRNPRRLAISSRQAEDYPRYAMLDPLEGSCARVLARRGRPTRRHRRKLAVCGGGQARASPDPALVPRLCSSCASEGTALRKALCPARRGVTPGIRPLCPVSRLVSPVYSVTRTVDAVSPGLTRHAPLRCVRHGSSWAQLGNSDARTHPVTVIHLSALRNCCT